MGQITTLRSTIKAGLSLLVTLALTGPGLCMDPNSTSYFPSNVQDWDVSTGFTVVSSSHHARYGPLIGGQWEATGSKDEAHEHGLVTERTSGLTIKACASIPPGATFGWIANPVSIGNIASAMPSASFRSSWHHRAFLPKNVMVIVDNLPRGHTVTVALRGAWVKELVLREYTIIDDRLEFMQGMTKGKLLLGENTGDCVAHVHINDLWMERVGLNRSKHKAEQARKEEL